MILSKYIEKHLQNTTYNKYTLHIETDTNLEATYKNYILSIKTDNLNPTFIPDKRSQHSRVGRDFHYKIKDIYWLRSYKMMNDKMLFS